MRKKAVFKGYVQGVGFRYTALMISRQFHVTGYVKNLPDGSVELVAEGDGNEVDEFISSVKGRKGMNICSVSEQPQPATGEFPDFSIRY